MTPPTVATTHWPRVSVVIPTFNRAAMVREAIESVLGQNYPNLEILVVDDGSSDNTADVVATFGPPVRYLHQENAGAASARNLGIRNATGAFVAFLDSDDRFLPGKLQAQVEVFLGRPGTVFVYCWYSIVDESGRRRLGRRCQLSGEAGPALLSQCMQGPLATPTVVVARVPLVESGGFDATMTLSEDIDLWCRLAQKGPIALVPEVFVEVRRHSGNLSRGPGRKRYLAAALRIIEKSCAADRSISARDRLRLRWKAHAWSWLVDIGGRLPRGLSFWLRALITNPAATCRNWLRGPEPDAVLESTPPAQPEAQPARRSAA